MRSGVVGTSVVGFGLLIALGLDAGREYHLEGRCGLGARDVDFAGQLRDALEALDPALQPPERALDIRRPRLDGDLSDTAGRRLFDVLFSYLDRSQNGTVYRGQELDGALCLSGLDPVSKVPILAAASELAFLFPAYATRLLRLSFLAPGIVAAILEGRQPPELTANKLMRDTRLPLEWTAQRQRLGFPTA